MNFDEFMSMLRDGKLFADLAKSLQSEARESSLSWLRLVKSEAIESWARSIPLDDIDIKPRECSGLMSLLLERHVLNLATRRDPSRLIDFWQWMIGSDYPQLMDLWQRHDPCSVMNDPCILHQEVAFGRLLAAAATELKGVVGLEWAHRQLRQWSAERDPSVPLRPQVRVVFALDGVENPPEALRPAFVVTFRLLSPTANPESLCSEPEVFGSDFLKVFDAVTRRIDRDPRQLEHDASFLGSGVLDGTSGTLALLTGQWLAARPRFIDEVWMTLPPWVVITATLDWQTDKAAGVGGVDAKVEVLAESGVRYVIVGDETQEDKTQPGELPKLDVCSSHADLHGLLFSGTVTQLADQLQHLNVLHQADMIGLQGTQLEEADPEQVKRLVRLRKFSFVTYDREKDFIPPVYAYDILRNALNSLVEGRGYVHLTGGPGIGKSTLVASMRPDWKGAKAPTGSVIGHAVLRGYAESPTRFIKEILRDAKSLLPQLPEEEQREEALSALENLEHRIFNRQSPMRIQDGITEILSCVRRFLGSEWTVIMAIDGLDELTIRDANEQNLHIHELLPDPATLDRGCYVLLTSRPELRMQVQQAVNDRRVRSELFCQRELSEQDPGYEQIVRAYVIEKLGSGAESHLSALLEKSQRRFIWVRLLVELLQLSGTDLSQIETGELTLPDIGEMLPMYVEQLESRVGAIDPAVVDWIRPTLLVTAAAFEPITREHYTAWLQDVATIWNKDARFRLDAALVALQPLLKDDRFSQPHDHAYSIAHREITKWLNSNRNPDWVEAIKTQGHARIVNAFANRTLTEFSIGSPSPIQYQEIYDLIHLIKLDQIEEAISLVNDQQHQSRVDLLLTASRDQLAHDVSLKAARSQIAAISHLIKTYDSHGLDRVVALGLTLQLAAAFVASGVSLWQLKQNEHAAANCNTAIHYCERLLYEANLHKIDLGFARRVRILLIRAYVNLGNCDLRKDASEKAIQYHRTAIAIGDQYKAEYCKESGKASSMSPGFDPNPARSRYISIRTGPSEQDLFEAELAIAIAHFNLSIRIQDTTQSSDLMACYANAFSIADALIKRSLACNNISNLYRSTSIAVAVLTFQAKYLKLYAENEEERSRIKELLTRALLLGDSCLKRALPTRPKLPLLAHISIASDSLGNIHSSENQHSEAIHAYGVAIVNLERAIQVMDRNESATMGPIDILGLLASLYKHRAKSLLDLNDLDGAATDLQKALSVFSRLQGHQREQWLDVYLEIRITLGNLNMQDGDLRQAFREFSEAVNSWNWTAATLDAGLKVGILAEHTGLAFFNLASICAMVRQIDRAEKFLSTSAELYHVRLQRLRDAGLEGSVAYNSAFGMYTRIRSRMNEWLREGQQEGKS
jgi:tetratricopeptide (TPR) repeat protein